MDGKGLAARLAWPKRSEALHSPTPAYLPQCNEGM
jgi:hypothetical protein